MDISNPDAVAVHCLLAGCHSVSDDTLPIMTSDFQSKHMLPNLPEGDLAWLRPNCLADQLSSRFCCRSLPRQAAPPSASNIR